MAEKAPASPPTQPTEAELRELLMRSDSMRQQLAAVEQQRELLLDLLGDARRALSSLEHIAKAKEGDEVLMPLGAGAFAHARLAPPERVIANLGASIHAEIPVADAVERMRARVESLETANSQLAKDGQRVADELARMNAVLEPYLG